MENGKVLACPPSSRVGGTGIGFVDPGRAPHFSPQFGPWEVVPRRECSWVDPSLVIGRRVRSIESRVGTLPLVIVMIVRYSAGYGMYLNTRCLSEEIWGVHF